MPADLLNFSQIWTEDLDADGGTNAGGKHIDAVLDRHGPSVGYAGKTYLLVHLVDKFFPGHSDAPFGFRLQHYCSLSHAKWRRVGGGLGAAGFTKNPLDLGKSFEHSVLHLQES